MARPKNKSELQAASKEQFEKLDQLVDSLPAEKRTGEFPPGTLNRNVRDVLAHLHHWHLMFLGWYEVGMTGKKPEMPARGHTWRSVPALNREINERYSSTPLAEIQRQLADSFEEVQQVIARHSDAELFTKKKYPWTGSTSLGAYLVSATSSHYDWAAKLIRKATKSAK